MRLSLLLAVSTFAIAGCGPLTTMCDDPRNDCDHPAGGAQRIADFRQSDPAARPPLAIPVNFRTTYVIGVDDFLEAGTSAKIGDIFIEQRIADENYPGCAPDPVHHGRVCGIQLFAPTPIPAGTHMTLGDIANVSGGQYEEFNCGTCATTFSDGRTLPEIGQPTVERVGSGLAPDPIDVTVAQLIDPDHGDDYVGVLVRITDVVTTTAISPRGEITLVPGLNMTGQLMALVDPSTGAPLAAGTRLTGVTGIASYFFGSKIIPRSVHDYTVMH
ncbi:MAG: hypothetical protein WCJ30_20195 [Deltaproteobacteria bacterium]